MEKAEDKGEQTRVFVKLLTKLYAQVLVPSKRELFYLE